MTHCDCCGEPEGNLHHMDCYYLRKGADAGDIINVAPVTIKASAVPAKDAVNSPSYYTAGKVEVIDYIEQVAATYLSAEAPLVANVIKYVSRAPLKQKKLEDLKKAQWYLNRLISKLENN
jgi:hypothetical protein